MDKFQRFEEGEISSTSDTEKQSDVQDEIMASATRGVGKNDTEYNVGKSTCKSTVTKKRSRSKKYDEMNNRINNIEFMLQKIFDKQSENSDSRDKQSKTSHDKRKRSMFDSSDENSDSDQLSLFAGGQISPEHTEKDDILVDSNNNSDDNNLSESTRKCLFEIFGNDAVVNKAEEKKGIVLDKSQIEVIENGYRCKQPNFLSSFAEENFDLFPVDKESEKFLAVPSLDDMIEVCLTKRYGSRASFAKARQLYSQPAKMIEKVAYKGQQAARLGLVIQMYVQQSLGNLLQLINSSDFDKEKGSQMVKDIFAMSTKCLDQLGRTGAFHHIVRRSCCMKDTGLHEQPDKWDYYNLPLSGDGVFGKDLESLLKDKKEKRKQVEDLLPELNKKRKLSGNFSEYNRKQIAEKPTERPSTSTYGNMSSFRIPKISRSDSRGKYRGRGNYSSGSFGARRSPAGRGKPVAKTDEK